MKNSILGFLLGIFAIMSIAATVPNSFMTVKPAHPKQIFVRVYGYQDEESMKKDIFKCHKLGYIVKSCDGAGSYGYRTLIMEKY